MHLSPLRGRELGGRHWLLACLLVYPLDDTHLVPLDCSLEHLALAQHVSGDLRDGAFGEHYTGEDVVHLEAGYFAP
jgi:hypothetical protein